MNKLKYALLFYTLLTSASEPLHAEDNSAKDRPNIVILYADDLGYGDLSIQNPQSKIPTPNLDKLAKSGVRFTDAHSSSGVCTPSRYALLEGRYHWRKFHDIVHAFGQPVLDAEKQTVAEMLKKAGYETACIGKWHLGWDWESIKNAGVEGEAKTRTKKQKPAVTTEAYDWSKPISGGPLSHGFEYYFGDDVPNFPPYAWFENDRVISKPILETKKHQGKEGGDEGEAHLPEGEWDFRSVMPTLTKKAEEWIGQRQKNKPFFLYFPFTSPHAPIVPAKEFSGKSGAGDYGDYVVQTDDAVGRVLAALEKHGLADNTLVIFSSDNGPEQFAYERIKDFDHRSMGPLRGLKRDIWEGGHRVPFIVSWPGKVPENKVSDGLISQIDVYATIAAVIGAEIPAGSAEDSFNQLALIKGEGLSARDTVVHNTRENGYALRQGEWVLIDAKSGSVSRVPEWFEKENGYTRNSQPGELYNLKSDIAEKKNLYAEMPEKVKELKATLEEVRAKGQVR